MCVIRTFCSLENIFFSDLFLTRGLLSTPPPSFVSINLWLNYLIRWVLRCGLISYILTNLSYIMPILLTRFLTGMEGVGMFSLDIFFIVCGGGVGGGGWRLTREIYSP